MRVMAWEGSRLQGCTCPPTSNHKMSARSLLRAGNASSSSNTSNETERSILEDPLISIHPKTKALRCKACDFMVVKHVALWSSHVLSKAHRDGVGRIKKEEELKQRKEEERLEKERRIEEERLEAERLEKEKQQALVQEKEKENADVKGKRKAEDQLSNDQVGDADGNKKQKPDQDEEWLAFQRELLGDDDKGNASNKIKPKYHQATIFSEPKLNVIAKNGGGDGEGDAEEIQEEEQESMAEKRKRLEREEKEEIYERYMEEIRLQGEVDER